MKFVHNWKQIALTAHSMWALYLSAICLVLPEIIYYGFGVDTNPRIWWGIALVLLIYGIIGRIKDQGIARGKMLTWFLVVALLAGGGFAQPSRANQDGFTGLAVQFIGGWEGLRLVAYRDIVGVWTVCFGETKGVKHGDKYTARQCDAMLAREISSYRAGLRVYFTAETRAVRLTAPREVAYVSLAYNVGVRGAGKSTATRRLNAGRIAAGCDALTWWNKAGGRVIRGLVRRRSGEYAMCMQGQG
ncbi:hypothetical protein JI58_08035 [Marinosulfonomonas sp. PRT-SC04]|nr:hypothetical protein JI58_08035 [Marinosulfonomonas sp. PRT-SC04]